MVDKRTKGESGVSFLKDIDIAGTNKIWYPRVKRRSHNQDRRYRYAIGLADRWVLDALKIPDFRKHPKCAELDTLPPGKYERILMGSSPFDPEKGVIRIERGIPHRINLAKPIYLTGTPRVQVNGYITLRIPTWVNSRQLYQWLKSENGTSEKHLLKSMQIAGFDPSRMTRDVNVSYGYSERGTAYFAESTESNVLIEDY